jgi:hypothetical protein
MREGSYLMASLITHEGYTLTPRKVTPVEAQQRISIYLSTRCTFLCSVQGCSVNIYSRRAHPKFAKPLPH